MELPNGRRDSDSSLAQAQEPRQELFDHQAASFEQRAGLPVAYCREIAKAVLTIGEVRGGDVLVEIGPGTGQIGQWFDERARYVGIDLSAGMLGEFQHRSGNPSADKTLIRADANAGWPLARGVARTVFSSRAIHLLAHEHVVSEVLRVAAHDGATMIIGRVEREHESVRARMSKEMNQRLRQHGFEGRGVERQKRKLFELFETRGAEILEPVTVAKWETSASPRASLDSWRSLKGLGGISVPQEIRQRILTELEEWATKIFGGLDAQHNSVETYVLKPVRLPHGASEM